MIKLPWIGIYGFLTFFFYRYKIKSNKICLIRDGEEYMITIGEKGPDFTIPDQDGQNFHLYSVEGKKILLSFHPAAFTGVCADQMRSLETNWARFLSLNTLPLGISVDTVPSKGAWAKDLDINNVRLLSDFWPHGSVAKQYGVFREKDGRSERANIILDEQKRVIFAKTYPISQLPDIEEIFKALQSQMATVK
jgi:peroxiredoxin